jgi:hypothetical protein
MLTAVTVGALYPAYTIIFVFLGFLNRWTSTCEWPFRLVVDKCSVYAIGGRYATTYQMYKVVP